MQSKKPCSAAKSIFATFITLLLASIVVPAQTQATKFKVLHTFKGSDGVNPIGQLVLDAVGNIYGTTGEGGSGKCENFGCGTAFKMSKTGKVLWQYSFSGANGRAPLAGLCATSREISMEPRATEARLTTIFARTGKRAASSSS